MKILVTGGTGLVGKSLQDILKTDSICNHEFIFVSSKDANLMIKEEVDKLFKNEKYDAIIHLAASVGGLYKNMSDNVNMYFENMTMNINIIKACHENNVNRGIFCLSSCIYPANPSEFPMTESMLHEGSPHDSNKGYAHAKRQLEIMCEMYSVNYQRRYICVSPVNLYGPHDNYNIENGHVLSSVMHRMYNSLKSQEFSMYGTGKALRQFLFAPDFAKAILKLLFDDSVKFGVYNICTIIDLWNPYEPMREYMIKDVIYMIAYNLNFPKEKIKMDVSKSDGIIKKTVTGLKFIKKYPGFKFTPLSEGLKITIKWMIDNYDSIRK